MLYTWASQQAPEEGARGAWGTPAHREGAHDGRGPGDSLSNASNKQWPGWECPARSCRQKRTQLQSVGWSQDCSLRIRPGLHSDFLPRISCRFWLSPMEVSDHRKPGWRGWGGLVCENGVGCPCHWLSFPGKGSAHGVGPRGRLQSSHPLVYRPAELSSTAGPQDQSEGRGSSLSIHSLPSGPSSSFPAEEQPVASWGLSFERLLQDPLGLAYFTVIPGVG